MRVKRLIKHRLVGLESTAAVTIFCPPPQLTRREAIAVAPPTLRKQRGHKDSALPVPRQTRGLGRTAATQDVRDDSTACRLLCVESSTCIRRRKMRPTHRYGNSLSAGMREARDVFPAGADVSARCTCRSDLSCRALTIFSWPVPSGYMRTTLYTAPTPAPHRSQDICRQQHRP